MCNSQDSCNVRRIRVLARQCNSTGNLGRDVSKWCNFVFGGLCGLLCGSYSSAADGVMGRGAFKAPRLFRSAARRPRNGRIGGRVYRPSIRGRVNSWLYEIGAINRRRVRARVVYRVCAVALDCSNPWVGRCVGGCRIFDGYERRVFRFLFVLVVRW